MITCFDNYKIALSQIKKTVRDISISVEQSHFPFCSRMGSEMKRQTGTAASMNSAI